MGQRRELSSLKNDAGCQILLKGVSPPLKEEKVGSGHAEECTLLKYTATGGQNWCYLNEGQHALVERLWFLESKDKSLHMGSAAYQPCGFQELLYLPQPLCVARGNAQSINLVDGRIGN